MLFQRDIKNLLKREHPRIALRNFVIQVSAQGYKKQTIYNGLYALALQYQTNNQPTEYEVLLDVLDMITGWYNGLNLDLN